MLITTDGRLSTLTSRSGFSKAAVVGSGMTLILVATTHWKTKGYNGTTAAYFLMKRREVGRGESAPSAAVTLQPSAI